MIPFKLIVQHPDGKTDDIGKKVTWPALPQKGERVMISDCFLYVDYVMHHIDRSSCGIEVHCKVDILKPDEADSCFDFLKTEEGFSSRW